MSSTTPRSDEADFSGGELARLYRERFTEHELEGKRRLWQALYDGYFRKMIKPSDTVLDLGAGSCEFINACHASTKIAVDLNPETKRHARDAQVVLASSDQMPEIADESVD